MKRANTPLTTSLIALAVAGLAGPAHAQTAGTSPDALAADAQPTASGQQPDASPVPAPAVRAPDPARAAGSEQNPTNIEAPVDDSDASEIVVTGVRRSVESALAVKRLSVQVSDSIIAEDIGKLPDNSVTEALQRVTGVQIVRAAGEGGLTLVRGLPNVVTTLNGRNIFTTTGRGIALADIPADLLKRVDVYKTPVPENIAGGIAGAIDVSLRRPFDLNGFTLSANARMVYSDGADRADPIVSGLIGDTWDTSIGRIGAMLSVSHQDRHFQESNTFNGTYDLVPDPGGSGANVYRPFVIGAIYNVGKRSRDSLNGSLQWQPSDNLTLYADGFYVKYKQQNQLNFFIPLPGLIGGPGTVTTLKPNSNVLATIAGNNVFSLTSNQAFRNSSETYQGAVGGEWKVGDHFIVTADGAYTKSTAQNRGAILDTSFIAPRLSVDFDRGGASSTLITNADGSPFSVIDPANFALNQFFDQYGKQRGSEYAGTANIEYRPDDSILTSLKIGGRYADRSATNQAANGSGVGVPAGTTPVAATDPRLNGIVAVSPDDLVQGAAVVDTRRFFVANANFLLNRTDIVRGLFNLPAGLPAFAASNFFNDKERILSGYGQATFDLDRISIPIDGVIGIRVENTKSGLRGTNTIANGNVVSLVPVAIDKNDTEYLPSANIRLKITPKLFVRFAAAKTVTRPNFSDLNPQTTLTSPGPTLPGGGTGGNPNLDNIKADAYDISAEWYFRPGSLISAAAFRRDVSGYVVTQRVTEFYPNAAGDPQRFDVNRPTSSGSGRLQGVEVAFTHFFDYLPGALSGLGVQLNGTYIDGKLDGLVDRTTTFPNVSKYAYNAILIYEKSGFSTRLAYNWRDKYFASFSEFQNVPTNNLGSVIVKSVGYLDLSTNYKVNDDFLLTFDAVNLLRTKTKNFFGGPGNENASLFPRDLAVTDRTFSIGARIRFH